MLEPTKNSIFEALPDSDVQIDDEPKVSNDALSASSLFDGLILLKFEPRSGDIKVSYVSDFVYSAVAGNSGGLVTVEKLNSFFGFGTHNSPESFQAMCANLLDSKTPTSSNWSGQVRTDGSVELSVAAEFRLLPLDLQSEDSGSVNVLVLVRDLARTSAGHIVGASQLFSSPGGLQVDFANEPVGSDANTAKPVSIGNDLGQYVFQIATGLASSIRPELDDEHAGCEVDVSVAIIGPTGHLSPVVLGGLPFELFDSLVDQLDRTVDSEEVSELILNSLSLSTEAGLVDHRVTGGWVVPIVGSLAQFGELTEYGEIYDFGHAQLRDFELSGLMVVTRRAVPRGRSNFRAPDGRYVTGMFEADPQPWSFGNSGSVPKVKQNEPPVSKHQKRTELMASAQQLVGEAIEAAYRLASESAVGAHDSLTSLPNRETALERLQQVLQSNDQDQTDISVLLIDIDKFQSINHSFGASTGDLVLAEIASRLLSSVRLGDQVARISSDQYLVVCATPKDELDPSSIAKRVLNKVNEPFRMNDGAELLLTSSAGLVKVIDQDTEPVDILSQAESALNRATAKGRGEFCVWDEETQDLVGSTVAMEVAIRSGIDAKEFVVYYQPLVDISSGRMVGAEALVRWEKPDGEIVSPIEFIGIAEESGLIVDLGMQIIDQVCEDLAAWPENEMGKPVVTINLSARQLESDMLLPGIISALRRNSLHPSSVGFEITESMEISNMEVALATLARLKELNCRIAIDDFGIGHATMEYLRNFSDADALKIDRSFVNGLAGEAESLEDTAIVTASIALADALGMQVVAEGVETVEQLNVLKKLNCRYGQGYGFSRPVTYQEAQQLWLKSFISPQD